MLKNHLRWFVLWSSRFPELLAIYLWMYRVIIRVATTILRRHSTIEALYLSRGCAKNQITPGISDIDFFIIVGSNEKYKQSLRHTYKMLGKATLGLVEYYPQFVITWEELNYLWQHNLLWRYRLYEGQTTWRLMHGRDLLKNLPSLTERCFRRSLYGESLYWWALFANILIKKYDVRDRILQNTICYKVVAELLNVRSALETGESCYSRQDALKKPSFPLADKLVEIASNRFLSRDDSVPEETCTFLFSYYKELWDCVAHRFFHQIDSKIRQDIDWDVMQTAITNDQAPKLKSLLCHVKTHWGDTCCKTHLVKSVFWKMEDILLIIDVDPDQIPRFQDLVNLTALYRKLNGNEPPNIFLFLRLQTVAFPLTPILPQDYYRGLLTPSTTPDIFLQLGETNVYWNDYTSWYLCDWKHNGRWNDASLDKIAQLSSITKSAQNGHIIYPLTKPILP